jgi:hypothetical protein
MIKAANFTSGAVSVGAYIIIFEIGIIGFLRLRYCKRCSSKRCSTITFFFKIRWEFVFAATVSETFLLKITSTFHWKNELQHHVESNSAKHLVCRFNPCGIFPRNRIKYIFKIVLDSKECYRWQWEKILWAVLPRGYRFRGLFTTWKKCRTVLIQPLGV